jgi:hypothetical protein
MDSPPYNTSKEASQEEVLRRFSHAEAFRTRKRPSFWLYLLINVLIFLAIGIFFIRHGGISAPWFIPLLIGMSVLGAYISWTRSSPVCPNCRKNIRFCPAVYCHLCGEPLKAKACDRCGVLQSWTLIFTSFGEAAGNKEPIRYCPGCAVLLDTDFHRWLGGGRRRW